MRNARLFSAVLLSVLAGFYSCSKTGAAGATGATGATGTANVMYSNWAALSMTYNSADSAYEQTIAADSITQSVIDSGLVLCYIKYVNSSNQTQLESADTYMEVVFGVGSINLYSYNYNYTGVNFRYVVVHGGAGIGSNRSSSSAATIRGYTKAEWKAMSYDQVMALLGEK